MTEALRARTLDARQIEQVFNAEFCASHNTCLQGGAEEPLYLPAAGGDPHRIRYRLDYAASALHEVAHWCVAGAARRQLEDYGYWYAPDGRSPSQQAEFERVEVRPQALEWVFASAAGLDFRVSADNLDAGLGPSERFKDGVHDQVLEFCQHGLPQRAGRFAAALARYAGVSELLEARRYRRDAL